MLTFCVAKKLKSCISRKDSKEYGCQARKDFHLFLVMRADAYSHYINLSQIQKIFHYSLIIFIYSKISF